MFKKIKNKIKNYLSPIFKSRNRELGFACAGICVGIIALIAAIGTIGGGVAAWKFKGEILKGLAGATTKILLALSGWAVEFSGNIFITMTGPDILGKSIIKADIVTHGWAIVRDFANMGIVLGFVIVGIATILRIKTYQAQNLLLPLILVALLINFSPLFLGIIIDASNITMNLFLDVSGPTQIVMPIIRQVNNQATIDKVNAIEDEFEYFEKALSIIAFNIIAAMVFFLFAFLFLFRHVALMILVILSPLAFLCYVFKATKGIWTKWWNNFFQWSIIGIPAAFFIYLAGHLITGTSTGGGPEELSGILNFWVPMGFLLFGYMLCFQTGAMGAKGAIGLATGTAAATFGAGLWVTKKGGKWAKETKAGKAVGKKTTGALERVGLIKTGASKQRLAKEREPVVKRMEGVDTDRLHTIAQQRGKNRMERMAALEALRKRKELKPGEYSKHRKELENLGFDTNEFDKAMPTEAKPTPDEAKLKPGETRSQAAQRAQSETTQRVVGQMSPREFRNNVQTESYTPEVFATMSPQQIEIIGKTGSQSQKQEIKSLTKKGGAKQADLQKLVTRLAREGKTKEWKQIVKNWNQVKKDANFKL